MNKSDYSLDQIVGPKHTECSEAYVDQFEQRMGYTSAANALFADSPGSSSRKNKQQEMLQPNFATQIALNYHLIDNPAFNRNLLQDQATSAICARSNATNAFDLGIQSRNNYLDQHNQKVPFKCKEAEQKAIFSNKQEKRSKRNEPIKNNNNSGNNYSCEKESKITEDLCDNVRQISIIDAKGTNSFCDQLCASSQILQPVVDLIQTSQSESPQFSYNVNNKKRSEREAVNCNVFKDFKKTSQEDVVAEVNNNVSENTIKNEDSDSDETNEEKYQKVRRCSSLKIQRDSSNSPAEKKIVRFADALGLDLADVRTFLDEIPSVPKSAYNDLENVELPNVEFYTKAEQISPKFLVPMFRQPGEEMCFLDRVRDDYVRLEKVSVTDCPTCIINGIVRVRNLDFHKSVYVRYTTDNWFSFQEIQANYIPNSCDGFSDQFCFIIYLYHLILAQQVQIAVRFHCKGSQFWDNNKGSNYVFQCLSMPRNYVKYELPPQINPNGSSFY